MSQQIDYSPLRSFGSIQRQVAGRLLKSRTFIVGMVAVIAFDLVLPKYAFLATVLVLGVFILMYQLVVLFMQNQAWVRFAQVNGWTTEDTFLQPGDSLIPPHLRKFDSCYAGSSVLHANINGSLCDVYIFVGVTVVKDKPVKSRNYTIARIKLDAPFPDMLLDSSKEQAVDACVDLPQRFRLEGDFDKHFTLYGEANSQIAVLSVITPDVMQVLIDSNYSQDIEVSGNHLYFCVQSDKRDENTMKALVNSMDQLAQEFQQRAKSIHLESAVA